MSKTLILDEDLGGMSSTGCIGIGVGTAAPRSVLDIVATRAGAGVLTLAHSYVFGGDNYAIKILGDVGTPPAYLGQFTNIGGFALTQGARYRGSGPWMPDATTYAGVIGYNGNVVFQTNSGLTPGSPFTPTERLRVDYQGNIGQGIIPSGSWWASERAHEFGRAGNAIFGAASDDEMSMSANAICTGSSTYVYGVADTASLYRQVSAQHVWSYAAAGTAGVAINFTEAMRITNAGQLSIGLTGAINGARLNVANTAGNSGATAMCRNNDATGASAWVAQDDTQNRYCELGVAGSATTLDSSYGAAGEGYVRSSGSASSLYLSAAAAAGYIRYGIGGAERARLTTIGFGIGTTAPAYPLDVKHATGGHLATGRTSNAGVASEPGNWYTVAPNASGASRIWSAVRAIVTNATGGAEASELSFSTQKAGALTEGMRLDDTGSVGIGTTAPAQKLQVNGGVFVTGPATLGATSSSGLMSMESTVFRNYVGDGSGWSWAFSKRAASATTDLIVVKDTGELLLGRTSVTANGGDLQLSEGITFPATQVPCSNPNTLDDYEEGTFTPVINGSNVAGAGTYSPAAVGRYTKIGNRVFISGSIQWTAHTGTGNIIVGGFPFVQNSTANNRAVFSLVIDNLTYSGSSIVMIGVAGTATAALLNQSSNATDTSVAMDATGSLFFSGHYDI